MTRILKTNCIPVIIFFILVKPIQVNSQNHTNPGECFSLYPTLINLAVEWYIEGDDNLNGIVETSYRKKGSSIWNEGMPLRRVPPGEYMMFNWKNKHSGSIFNLTPDTEYEIKLSLMDPDGGSDERVLIERTRPIPVIDQHANIIDLKPGFYDTLQTYSGTREKPVVYLCSKGIATYSYINLMNKKWVYIQGLNVSNIEQDGIGIRMNGAENCMVRNCIVNAVYGIVAYLPGAKNCYISDNVVTGISKWTREAMGANGKNIGEGIQMTGPGNVICYNKVTGFRDCISTMEERHANEQYCIDIYNNDVYTGPDDGIEADFCFSNCRIFRNRLTNCFVGLSSQPGLGGPTYFYKNVMYNIIHATFKLKRYSRGDVVLHNTVVKVGAGLAGNSKMDHAFFRNNLAIGGPTGDEKWGGYGAGRPYGAEIFEPGLYSDFDYDAVGVFEVPYIAKIGGNPFSEIELNGIEKIRLEEVFPGIEFPYPPIPEREVPDLRPASRSKVIDAGLRIPNMNDDYLGTAPDCGAYEAGQDLPHYGPRN